MRLRGTSKRLVVALLLLGATASCAYYNTFYLARKYYFKATDGLPYEVDRENTTQRSNYSKSADYSKKLLGVYPRSKWVDDAWLLWAGTLIGTDDPLKAVAMLEEFQTRFPKSDLRPDATFFLGLAYRAARKHEKAVESFNEFLAQSPRHVLTPYAYYERSRAQLSLQRYSDAAASAGEILQRWPGHVLYDRALRQRAEARFQQHDWKGARADFHSIGERALTDDDRLRYLLREVDCLEASRDLDAARAQLRDARSHVELPPVVPEPPRVASSPLPGGAQPTPQPVYTQPTPAQERYGRITLRMGGVELLSGHAKEAVELYQTVLHDYPRSQLGAEAQFRIAFAYETGADDFSRARAEYGKVKEQAGTSQFSQQAQQRLDNLERIERFRTAGGADSAERKAESRFLVAEHYLFNLERPERAVEEYRAIAESSSAKAVKARALNAEAWVMSRKLDRKSAADSLFWTVVRGYPETEAQLAARDYLEGEGQAVPEDLIVPPKEFSKPVLELTEELPKPPAGTPPLGSRPALDPDASPLGPGLKPPPGVTPPITPPSWRPGSSPDSLRREIALRDSLLRAARRDTSTAGRARVDSLRRTFSHPDTAGRGALLAEIQRRQPKPVGVVIAPDSLAPPPFSAGDTSATRTPSRLGPPINAPSGPNPAATGAVVEARPTFPARDTAAAGHSARTPDSTQRALPSRTPPAPAVPASPPKPSAPEGFSSVWVHFTKAQRDSIKHAKASYDSSMRAQKALAKVAARAKKQAKHSKTPADSTAKGAQ